MKSYQKPSVKVAEVALQSLLANSIIGGGGSGSEPDANGMRHNSFTNPFGNLFGNPFDGGL